MRVTAKHLLDGAYWKPSDFCEARPAWAQPELVVVHCISLPEGEFGNGAPERLFLGKLELDEHASFADLEGVKVAPHLLIDRQGVVHQFVAFDQQAWHAGVSVWRGRTACNRFSIGIELEGCVSVNYAQAQYTSLILVLKSLFEHYPSLSRDALVGHNEIAAGRKTDPGPTFDWRRIHRELYGHGESKRPG